MKKAIIFGVLLLVAYVAYDEYDRRHGRPVESSADQVGEAPHWEDVEREMARERGSKSSLSKPPGDAAVTQEQASPTARDGWSEGGGLVGRVGSFFGGIVENITYFLFGAPPESEESEEAPAPSVNKNQDDPTKHFSRVEGATVSIDYGISKIGAPQEGATGFIVTHQGRLYVVTNIHVIEGFAESEADLTWYEGPKMSAHGERDARYARQRIAFHAFDRPGVRPEPSYLGFMARTDLPTFRTRDGRVLSLGRDMLLSRSRDIALLPVQTEIPPLQFSRSAPTKQENIFIVSNPEAAGTVYLVRGSVKGIGPDRLELRMDGSGLVGGMSGSPVVSASSGRVIGVVSYSRIRPEFDPEQVIKEERTVGIWGRTSNSRVRDFGYRLDNLDDLAPVSWGAFCVEMGILHALRERTRNVLYAVDVPVRAEDYTTVVPHRIQPDFNGDVARLHRSMAVSSPRLARSKDLNHVYKSLDAYRGNLEDALNKDMRQLQDLLKAPPVTVPYFQRLIAETIERDQQSVLQYIRRKAGKLPARPSG
jgi:hypothetical protein